MKKQVLGPLCLALAASIWGGMYVVSKVVLEVVPPMGLVWLRYLLGIATLVILGLATRQSWRIRKQDVPVLLAIGITGYAVSITAQFIGTKLSTAQMGSVITAATPAFMVIFAYFLLKEKLTRRKGLSVVLATVGVLCIVGIGDLGDANQLGGLALVVAAITWALMSVLVKRVPADYSQLVVTSYSMLVAAVLLTPFSIGDLLALELEQLASPTIWGGILFLGIVSTAGAFFLWNKGLQMVDAATGGLYFFFQPLVGTLLGWLLLGEQVTLSFWVGSTLIIAGVIIESRNERGVQT